jgi:hypothetical protein
VCALTFVVLARPMMKPAEQGWGSCPIDGRDWGASEKTERSIIDELTRKLDQNRLDAGKSRLLLPPYVFHMF